MLALTAVTKEWHLVVMGMFVYVEWCVSAMIPRFAPTDKMGRCFVRPLYMLHPCREAKWSLSSMLILVFLSFTSLVATLHSALLHYSVVVKRSRSLILSYEPRFLECCSNVPFLPCNKYKSFIRTNARRSAVVPPPTPQPPWDPLNVNGMSSTLRVIAPLLVLLNRMGARLS